MWSGQIVNNLSLS